MGSDAPLCDIAEDKLVQFETVVKKLPQIETESPQMISQGPSVCVFNKEDNQEVLASWLFAQYLLTNEVQIAYAQTEGYVPVTSKAQESAEYQDYLSRAGEDNDKYYNIKIDATKLLIDNVDNTFVTPVFNGSASLRNAAGQLIENTVKAVRRGQTVDDTFIKGLYDDVNSLYRLDQLSLQTGGQDAGKVELGALPSTAIGLIAALVAAWVLIGLYVVKEFLKSKKK
jgi:multiple sugar transport system substrate-binding protein